MCTTWTGLCALFHTDVPQSKDLLSNYFDAKSARVLSRLLPIAGLSVTPDSGARYMFALVFLLQFEDKM